MSELRGCLQDFGLVALVRFLSDQGRSGSLRISYASWAGDVVFERGRLIAAAIGEERGQAALELIALALADGDFVYTDGPPNGQPNIEASIAQVQAELERLLSRPRRHGITPILRSIPRLAELRPEIVDQEVVVSRAEIALLFEVDGRRDVEWMVRGRNPVGVLHTLTRLSDAGVITLEPPDELPGPPVPLNGSNGTSHAAMPVARAAVIAEAAVDAEPPPQTVQRGPPPEAHRSMASIPAGARRWIADVLRIALLTAVFLIGIRLLVQSVHVEGESMLPGLREGQLVLINRMAYFHLEGSDLAALVPATAQGSLRYLFGGPRRGDVIVFQAPSPPDAALVKRVVGLPGEQLRIDDGQVFIDDRLLDEPYAAPGGGGIDRYPVNGEPLRIPEDSYFVLGDNRAVSLDSRLGWLVRADDLIGQLWLTYWPPTQWGLVAHAGVAAMPQAVATPEAGVAASFAAVATSVSVPAPTPPPTLVPVPTPQPATPRTPVLLAGPVKDQFGWPSDPLGVAWFEGPQYRLATRQPAHFVALAAPVAGAFSDVQVSAAFHKTGGPPGGGYGVFVRDVAVGPRDGVAQGGQFYVAEVGDRGEVGIWRREHDRWVDLLPWTVSQAVHSGGTTNDLLLRAEGNRLTFLVNGAEVPTVVDSVLAAGRVGVFVGGDLNEVTLDRFSVELLGDGTAP